MKNPEIWREANRYSSKLMYKFALAFMHFEVLTYFLIHGKNSILISGIFLAIISIAVIPFTEIHLRKKFDKNGNPKP